MFLFSDGSISCFTPPIRKPLIYTPILKAEGFLWSVWKSGCVTTAAPGELSVLFSALVVWLFSLYHSKFDVQPDALAKLPLLLLGSFRPSVLLVLLIILFSSRTSSRDYRILKKHVQY